MQLTINRDGAPVTSVTIDENTVFTHKHMGEHKIIADFIVPAPIPVQLGDYIEHEQERFYINRPPGIQKINNITFQYVIEFEGEIYGLYNKRFQHNGQSEFTYTGTPEEFILLLVDNINSIAPGWAIENVEEGPVKTMSFSSVSCREALTEIAQAYEMEFRLVGRNIYLQKTIGVQTTHVFEYARGLGLYSLTRNAIDDRNVVTRVYGFGASKNIDYNYRDGATRLVFEGGYLEKNTDKYGIIEGDYTDEEVFPTRTGTVTGINPENRTQIIDSTLNFDVNDHLIEGTVAKIVFKSGALENYEFEINRYRHGVKTIDFSPFSEQNGYTLPNTLNFPEVGDEYTIVDITMPQVYIDEAEQELQDRTQNYLNENSVPRVNYTLPLDEKYLRDRGTDLKVANLVRVIDTDLGVNDNVRIAEVSYPLVNPKNITAVLANYVPYTIQERLIADTIDNQTETRDVDRRSAELARRQAARFRQLQNLIFDPDGYFDTENIRPGSIETLMLSVGAKSQNFNLSGVTIQPNADGDPNILKISGGELIHYEIEIESLGYVWEIDPVNFSGLNPAVNYYVYAKCAKTSLTGTFEISEDPRRVEDEIGYYLFNLGILYDVKDGRRDFDFTNGMTFINGDTITTGRIKSLDGLNYFDLSESKFFVGNQDASLDYNVTNPGQLTLKGILKADNAIIDGAEIQNLIAAQVRTNVDGRRLEIRKDGNYLIIYDANGKEVVRLSDLIDPGFGFGDVLLAGLKASNPSTGRFSLISGNGIYSNTGTIKHNNVTGSVIGVLTSVPSSASFAAAIVASCVNASNKAVGIYCEGGILLEGRYGVVNRSSFCSHIRTVSSNTTISERDHIISCYNSSPISLNLPRTPPLGHTLHIRRNNQAAITLIGNGKRILRNGVVDQTGVGDGRGDCAVLIFDGQYWLYNVIFR